MTILTRIVEGEGAELAWQQDKPGRWIADGYMILEERGLPPTLEEALAEVPVFSWKADEWLFRDMRSEATLEAAMSAAQTHATLTHKDK